jgi:copper chaperone
MKSIEKTENSIKLILDNIKCGGCANTITKAMEALEFKDVAVDPENHTLTMSLPQNENQLNQALDQLKNLGYPLVETEEGLKALALKAKSYISCAIGKFGK